MKAAKCLSIKSHLHSQWSDLWLFSLHQAKWQLLQHQQQSQNLESKFRVILHSLKNGLSRLEISLLCRYAYYMQMIFPCVVPLHSYLRSCTRCKLCHLLYTTGNNDLLHLCDCFRNVEIRDRVSTLDRRGVKGFPVFPDECCYLFYYNIPPAQSSKELSLNIMIYFIIKFSAYLLDMKYLNRWNGVNLNLLGIFYWY